MRAAATPPTPDGKPSKPSTSSFAGMAAGPKAPRTSRSLRKKNKKRPKSNVPAKPKPESAQSDLVPERDVQEDRRATRALGRRKLPAPIAIQKKSASDFIAEGVVDDVEDTSPFAEADIRFGIDDVQDPFKRDDVEEKKRRDQAEEENVAASVGRVTNVTGDGSVTKCIITSGSGNVVSDGATVRVQYQGCLEDGTVFDDTSKRGAFEFVLGKGNVIKGWEAALATMRLNEVAEFVIAPPYAYGRRGMPPVIPGNATLTFKIELVGFDGGKADDIRKVSDFNPDIARTPEQISLQYDARLQTQAERRKKMTLLDRFYIISPFASQTGERPPWWINPNITFVLIMVSVGIGFYLVLLSGAIHIGYVDHPVDVNIFK